MFDDRLEVSSPGSLVRGITIEDLGTGKYAARNPTLAEAMRELVLSAVEGMGLIERFGTGIRMMRREMETLGSAPPIFAVDEDSFTATLPARELELWRNEGRRRYEMHNGPLTARSQRQLDNRPPRYFLPGPIW
jgi:predicted HTH transcriptional regulator